MEQRISVETSTKTIHYLPMDQRKILYTYLALSQYNYLCNPKYNQNTLLKMLSADIRKFLVEAELQAQQQPNNLALNRMVAFFQKHHRNLKTIMEEIKQTPNP